MSVQQLSRNALSVALLALAVLAAVAVVRAVASAIPAQLVKGMQ